MICTGCGCKLELNEIFCSHCGKPTGLAGGNLGRINVIREKKVFGFAIPFEVFVDESKLGSLTNNSTLSCDVPLGNHVVKIKSLEQDVTENITIEENKKEVDIKVVPKIGLLAAKPKVVDITYK